jgi:16S rRNA (uracil1498-N3)-methyltransferase
MPRFRSDIAALYLPMELSVGRIVELPDEEAQHARALRLREGDPLVLLDGRGARAEGVVERIDRRGVGVRIRHRVLDEADGRPYIALGIGLLSDRARLEWIIEKGVELGVREIIPLTTERAEGRFNLDRAMRIAIAALKQSQSSFLPVISDPLPLAAIYDRLPGFGRTFLCHESAPSESSLARFLISSPAAGPTLLLIGPEGGFSDAEVREAADASARVVSLGEARLRAETAALVALTLVAQIPAG